MALEVEKATKIGFCFGVKQAIEMLEKLVRERGRIETLGAVVHNQQVLQRLANIGINVANSIDEVQGKTVAITTHGVSPEMETEIRARFPEVINTTCPFVQRAQVAARRLARSGFYVIVYGDANHPEVKGILGYAEGKGIATRDINMVQMLPRRSGILSQTTEIPSRFAEFVRKLIDSALVKDAELRIIDTICHDIRDRQQAALGLANRVDLMLVIGSHTSANTKHLAELCVTATETRLIESAEEIRPSWIKKHRHIGVTGGASTAEETINEVVGRLKAIAS
jgi:4-hydroxy-3-methylbut-2-enyl diphosphate reductase